MGLTELGIRVGGGLVNSLLYVVVVVHDWDLILLSHVGLFVADGLRHVELILRKYEVFVKLVEEKWLEKWFFVDLGKLWKCVVICATINPVKKSGGFPRFISSWHHSQTDT